MVMYLLIHHDCFLLGDGARGHWEQDIQEFCSNTISSLILGTRMEFQCVSDCLQAMLMISR